MAASLPVRLYRTRLGHGSRRWVWSTGLGCSDAVLPVRPAREHVAPPASGVREAVPGQVGEGLDAVVR